MAENPDEPDEGAPRSTDKPTGTTADAHELADRLADVHRRTEDLAARVASFQAATSELADSLASDPNGAAPNGTEPTGGEPGGDADDGSAPEAEPAAVDAHGAATPAAAAAPVAAAAAAAARRPRPVTRPDTEPTEPGDAPAEAAADAPPETTAETAESAATAEPAAPKRPRPGPGPAAEKPAGGTTAEAAAAEADTKPAEKAAEKPPAKPPEKPETAEKAPKKKRRGMPKWLRTVRSLLIAAVVIVAAAWALRTYVASPYYVPSASMEPTLHGCPSCNNDHVLVQKLSYDFHDPARGDIVVFENPGGKWAKAPDKDLIKRVIGVPGDRISIRKRHVYINGAKENEPYVNKACHGTAPMGLKNGYRVPKGDIFVMGDNRCDSEDSRMFGPVPIDKVVGKALIIFWPVSRFGSP